MCIAFPERPIQPRFQSSEWWSERRQNELPFRAPLPAPSMNRLTTQFFKLLLPLEKCDSEVPGASVSAKSPLPYIPPELWDLVLRELCDDALFNAGRVCHAFNSRCTTIYFEREDIVPQSLADGSLNIASYSLPALLLPTSTPQIRTLVCRFSERDQVVGDLKRLRVFLALSHSIEDVRLIFPDEDYTIDPATQEAGEAREALLKQISHVSREMARKTAGPVYIIPSPRVYMIGHWGSHPWFDFTPDEEENDNIPRVIGGSRLVWGHFWSRKFAPCSSPANPGSMRLQRISGTAGPFSFITFDQENYNTHYQGMLWFELGRSHTRESPYPSWDANSPDLTAILPHLTLPALSYLQINERIDPTTLTQFLLRHPTITSITYEARDEFASAPMALPALTHLSCEYIAQLIPLLDAFECSSLLYCITIRVERETPGGVAWLKYAIRRLSMSSISLPINLHIHLVESDITFDGEEFQPIDEDERHIVGCLYGVNSVVLRSDSIAAAQTFIPWLTMLPALRRLDLELKDESRTAWSPAAIALLEETRAAMPWVLDIDFYAYH
ncbi:hypothetical protein C8R43DRAFT_512550 [Mycena crocata]|nr:hypothetical protein C8R43DRAFT_512550 [Mycena crocata]